MLKDFNPSAIVSIMNEGTDNPNESRLIRFMPGRSRFSPSSERNCIPGYFIVSNSPGSEFNKILRLWNYNKTYKNKHLGIYNYHTLAGTPVARRHTENDFYRIEGHIGLTAEQVDPFIRDHRAKYGLDFKIQWVKMNGNLNDNDYALGRDVQRFSDFARRHPGILHAGGVERGGTFVIAYIDKTEESSQPMSRSEQDDMSKAFLDVIDIASKEEQLEGAKEVVCELSREMRASHVYAEDILNTLRALETSTDISISAKRYMQSNGSYKVLRDFVGSKAANAPASVESRTVVADFSLSYVCCEDPRDLGLAAATDACSFEWFDKDLDEFNESYYNLTIQPYVVGGETLEYGRSLRLDGIRVQREGLAFILSELNRLYPNGPVFMIDPETEGNFKIQHYTGQDFRIVFSMRGGAESIYENGRYSINGGDFKNVECGSISIPYVDKSYEILHMDHHDDVCRTNTGGAGGFDESEPLFKSSNKSDETDKNPTEAEIAEAQANFTAADSALKLAQKTLEEKEAAVTAAQTKLEEATEKDKPAAQKALDTAIEERDQAKLALVEAQNAYDAAKAVMVSYGLDT